MALHDKCVLRHGIHVLHLHLMLVPTKSFRSTFQVFDLHDRRSADWLYRGKLAERLLRLRSAVQAYRMSSWKNPNMRANVNLLSLYSRHGVLKEALQVIGHLVKASYPTLRTDTDTATDRSSGCLQSDKDILREPMHPVVRKSIFELVARYGLSQVRTQCTSICGEANTILGEVLADAVELRVYGYDA